MQQPQTLIVDLDGVIVGRTDYFSERAKSLFPHADHAAIQHFFTSGAYKAAAVGKHDLREAVAGALPSWKVSENPDEILRVWFEGENEVNEELVEFIQTKRKEDMRCIIATDHSERRKRDVWENLCMKEYFDAIVSSSDVGTTKSDPFFFTQMLSLLSITDPAEALFIDDDPANTEVAESVGIPSVVFESVDALKERLQVF